MSERVGRWQDAEKPPIVTPVHVEPRHPTPEKLIIQVAPTGGQITKEQNPHQPYSAGEIAQQVIDAYKQGASVFHVHVRDERGFGTKDPELHRKIVGMVKAECPDMIMSFCVSRPLQKDTVEDRLKGYPLELADMALINLGSMNVGKAVFVNSEEYITSGTKYLEDIHVKPELVAYNLRMIDDALELLVKPGIAKPPYWFNLAIGIHSAIPATLENLRLMVSRLREKIPDSKWLASAGGRYWLPILTEAVMLGGHVRLGMEDSMYVYPWRDDAITGCGEITAKVVRIAKELGREIATPEEAMGILKLHDHRRARLSGT